MKLLAVFLGLAYSNDIPAKCDVPCPMNIEPVCATDGQTYTNKCMFKNEQCLQKYKHQKKLVLAYQGECVDLKEKCQLGCPRNYDPICAYDGHKEVTFSNECEFRKEVCLSKNLNLIVTRHAACTHENL